MNDYPVNIVNAGRERNAERTHSAPYTHHSRLAMRRGTAGFTLIEILIAIFVFLIGILGVLSMFPVAMNSASRTMGQVRGNILAQSSLAQLTADCKVPYAQGKVNGLTTTDSTLGVKYATGWADDDWNGYHVSFVSDGNIQQSRLITATVGETSISGTADSGTTTTLTELGMGWVPGDHVDKWLELTGGTGVGQHSRITANTPDTVTVAVAFATAPDNTTTYEIVSGNVLTVCPDWNPVPPDDADVTITRMALPVPLKGTIGSAAGLNIIASDVTWVDDQWNGYYVTMLDTNQSRRITDTVSATNELILDLQFAPVPGGGEKFIITRTPCGTRPSSTLTADANPDDLVDTDSTWVDDEWNGYYVRILSSDDALNECRRISDTDDLGDLLNVSPDWTTGKEPEDGDTYAIIPPPRHGYIRSIVGDAIHAGIDSGQDVVPLTWNTGWVPDTRPPGTCPNNSTASTLQVTGADAAAAKPGQIVVITGDLDTCDAAGQVRIIVTSDGVSELTVFPDWEEIPVTSDGYEIRDRLGYFLVITSGRATNRAFFITGYAQNPGAGDEITCAGADFGEIGVTQARLGSISADYKLRNATSFVILGADDMISSVIGYTAGNGMVPQTVDANEYGYLLNSFGIEKTVEPQTGTDVFFEDGTEHETSEYSSVCIFSDAGSLSKGPVRADIFVYRNFNRAFPLAENRKPVGVLTGYIGRP